MATLKGNGAFTGFEDIGMVGQIFASLGLTNMAGKSLFRLEGIVGVKYMELPIYSVIIQDILPRSDLKAAT